jgi:uncharacterized protein YerC
MKVPAEQVCQDRTAKKGLPGQYCQDRTAERGAARTGLKRIRHDMQHGHGGYAAQIRQLYILTGRMGLAV